MATITYKGAGGMRILTTEDGFSVDLCCRPGIPMDVTDEDAELVRATALRTEFTVDPPQAPTTDDQAPAPPAETAVRTKDKAS